MAQTKILVTGATGFTGGHLARRLARNGESVRVLVRNPERATELAAMGMEIVVGDLTDPVSLDQAMEGIELVYHIAASFRQENITTEEMWAINYQGVKNMLDAAIKAGTVKRFVPCSTIGVHGDVKNPPATEETPYGPGDYYQESKTAGEKIAIEYMEQGKLPIVIFRPGGIYGPGDTRFLKLFKPIKKQRFVMMGSGEILYQLVYIDDLVDGIILCGTVGNAVGNIYILTGKEAMTLNQFTRSVARSISAYPVSASKRVGARRSLSSTTAIRRKFWSLPINLPRNLFRRLSQMRTIFRLLLPNRQAVRDLRRCSGCSSSKVRNWITSYVASASGWIRGIRQMKLRYWFRTTKQQK